MSHSKLGVILTIFVLCITAIIAQPQQAVGSMDSLRKALAATNEPQAKINVLNALSKLAILQDPDAAIDYARQARAIALQVHDIHGALAANVTISYALSVEGNYAKALEISFDNLQQARLYRFPFLEGRANGCITNVYIALQETDSALRYGRETLRLYRQVDSPTYILRILGNIGRCFSNARQLDSALFYYETVKKYEQQLLRPISFSTIGHIGEIYMLKGQYTEALPLLKQAVAIARKEDDRIHQPKLLYNLGLCLSKMGQFDDAFRYTSEALALANQLQTTKDVYEVYQLLGDIAYSQGKHQLAFDMVLKYRNLEDSIKGDTMMKAVARIEVSAFLARKEMENTLLRKAHEADNERLATNRIILVIGVLLFILAGLLAFALFRLYQARQKALIDARNAQLNEYTRQNSHLLRARVATMLGLLSLFRTEKLAPKDKQYFETLVDISTGLDKTIHEINDALHQHEQN